MVLCFLAAGWTAAAAQTTAVEQPAKAQTLFQLANAARTEIGLRPLEWNASLAVAALRHCERMAAARTQEIAHRYSGELDLTMRTAAAGAHFSLVEENIAVGSRPERIHQGWMESPGHRANLLDAAVDQVGIAVIDVDELSFAVQDFARGAVLLSQEQVEATIAALLRAQHVMVAGDTDAARTYCRSDAKYRGNDTPAFLVRWQNPDLSRLPQPLQEQLSTWRYRRAAVGSCPPRNVNGGFTTYRVAVLLY
jgi:hypothetical protein